MFCPHCGKEIAGDQAFCQHCGASLSEPVPGPVLSAGGRTRTPWEDRENFGFFGGLFRTLKEVLFSPSAFFRKMTVKDGLFHPLLYALIIGMFGLMFFYSWQILLKGAVQNFMPSGVTVAAGPQVFNSSNVIWLAALSPFFIIAGLFISSGILHIFLMLVKGARAGFEATFRVVAYGHSTQIFFVLPICGSFLVFAWAIVISIIGLREAHEISGGKATFAVFFPLVLCCGLLITTVMLFFMGALVASFGALMQMYK